MVSQARSSVIKWKWRLLLACLIAGAAVVMCLPSNVSAQVLAITAPTGLTGATFAYNETAQTLISTTGTVQADVAFTVTVTDSMAIFGTVAKTLGSDGKMHEATATSWVDGGLVLLNPVQVGSTYADGGATAEPLTSGGVVIISSTTQTAGAAEVDMLATVTQALDLTYPGYDEPAPGTNVYRIVLRFTIAEKV